MKHDTERGDMSVVRDEIENERREPSRRERERERESGYKEVCIFHQSHNKAVGDSTVSLSACALHHLQLIK